MSPTTKPPLSNPENNVSLLQDQVTHLQQQLRVKNEQYDHLLAKWEKLKEAAKKKRDLRNIEDASHVKASTSPPQPSPLASDSSSLYYSVHSQAPSQRK